MGLKKLAEATIRHAQADLRALEAALADQDPTATGVHLKSATRTLATALALVHQIKEAEREG
jgi:hypothetical protein